LLITFYFVDILSRIFDNSSDTFSKFALQSGNDYLTLPAYFFACYK